MRRDALLIFVKKFNRKRKNKNMNYLVVVAHPDDEVLGAGATIHKRIEDGHKVAVAIMVSQAAARRGLSYTDEYKESYSSDTSLFLLQRIEYGCEGKTYQTRMVNEQRIDTEDIMKMSKLTRTILDGTDYDMICEKRRKNFEYVSELLEGKNQFNPWRYYSIDCVPMVYPLVIEDDGLLQKLLDEKHFQGHWWSYLLEEMEENCFEYWMSRYMIPITIDQRYGEKELEYVAAII